MRIVTDEEVLGALDFGQAITALETAFFAHGNGTALNLPRMRAGLAGCTVSTMGAALPYCGLMGAKIYPTIQGRFNFYLSLFDDKTGEMLALMQGNALTSFRTAAGTVIAARLLARPEARTLCLFGSGVQARAHAQAFAAHSRIKQVLVVDPHGDAAGFCSELAMGYGLEASVCDAGSAVERADIIVTATRSTTPLFQGDAVRAGTFVAAIGSSKPDAREVDDTLLRRCTRIAVEDRAQALREAGELALATPGSYGTALVELGELLVGSHRYERARGDINLYKSIGIGIEDIALAHAVWQRLQGKAAAHRREHASA